MSGETLANPSPHAEGLHEENERLRAAVEELRSRLSEPEEIVRAVREGEVDAFVISEPHGERIYSLRSAEQLYRGMVEEMQEGAVALDASGLIVYCNRFFAGLLEVERSALLGASILPHVTEESRPFFEALREDTGQGTPRAELVLRTARGATLPVLAAMNRMQAGDGDVFCLMITDLTERRRREELMVESRRKDEFLAMLAHELRNPIAPIRNAAHLLHGPNQSDERVRWASEVIDRQATQLTRLVDDLLDVSRITRGKIQLHLEIADLATVIGRGIETARPAVEGRGHALTVDMPRRPLLVNADAARLSQVVSNLLHNAAKFTPEGGHIWVELSEEGGQARISVRDSGIGIPADMLDTVFDLFTQVDATPERAQGGLGIGLTLVRSLVQMHGGTVQVRSEGTGRGAEVVVLLPLASASAAAPSPGARSAGTAPGAVVPLRLLVVDDNLDAAESLALVLRDMGHDARTATNPGEVVDTARAWRPHVVFLDIGLPVVDGYQVARRLRETPELAGVCLVALTGYGQEESRRRSKAAGFDFHWVKPLDPHALEDLLRDVAARTPTR